MPHHVAPCFTIACHKTCKNFSFHASLSDSDSMYVGGMAGTSDDVLGGIACITAVISATACNFNVSCMRFQSDLISNTSSLHCCLAPLISLTFSWRVRNIPLVMALGLG